MIIKKHNYTDNHLSNTNLFNNFFFFDIETTGLQKNNSIIYLIGCAVPEDNSQWAILQWFAENPDEEQMILEEFTRTCEHYGNMAHYNGDRFDIPFVEYRCSLYGLSSPFIQKESHDLYKILKPCAQLLSLRGRKQADLEAFLEFQRTDTITGKEGISIYRNLIKYRDSSYSEPLLLHNKEDLEGLFSCTSMYSYLHLLLGEFSLGSADIEQDRLIASFRLDSPLPKNLSILENAFELQASYDLLTLILPITDGKLKTYYPNWKEYYYLPKEDTAIHKSIGNYVDKTKRIKADRAHCYTWFSVTEEFLENQKVLEQYLRTSLLLLLDIYSNSK